MLRSLDNNHLLAIDSADLKLFRNIKEIKLSQKNTYATLSIGGEVREQLRYFNNLNFGDANPTWDFYIQQRYMLHADLSINKYLRLFTQLNSTNVNWKNSVTAKDKEKLDFMQAFLDIRIAGLHSNLRFGRQELQYGAERILGPDDGPNNRQTFDGIKYTLNTKKFVGDLALVRPVVVKPEMFDNDWSSNRLIPIGYVIISLPYKSLINIYYFGDYQKAVSPEGANITNKRHSIGARLSKSSGSLYYDIEGTLQRGTYYEQNIRGWQITVIPGYRWRDVPLSPNFQFRVSIYSGNKDTTDNQINSFIAISAKPTINDLLSVGPTNMILLAPKGAIEITSRLDFFLTWFVIWRLRNTDGLYSKYMETMTRPIDKPGQNLGLYVATGPTAELAYNFGKHFNILFQTGIFFPGNYIKNTGVGKNVQAVALKTYYRF